jgi:hypothetical protein
MKRLITRKDMANNAAAALDKIKILIERRKSLIDFTLAGVDPKLGNELVNRNKEISSLKDRIHTRLNDIYSHFCDMAKECGGFNVLAPIPEDMIMEWDQTGGADVTPAAFKKTMKDYGKEVKKALKDHFTDGQIEDLLSIRDEVLELANKDLDNPKGKFRHVFKYNGLKAPVAKKRF